MTQPQNTEDVDILQMFDSVPSVSFDPGRGGVPEGQWVTLEVTGYIKQIQAKDDKGAPRFHEDSGRPVYKAVLPVLLDGEERALWAKKNWVEGGLFRSLAEAQRDLGHRIGPGTKLAVRWSWDTSKPKKLGNHPKKYEVRASGEAPAPADPLADTPPASAPTGSGFGAGRVTQQYDEPPF